MTCQPGAFSDVFPIALKQLQLLFMYTGAQQPILYYSTPAPFYALQLIRILRYKTTWTIQERSLLEEVALMLFNRGGETLPVRAAFSYFIVFSELIWLVAMRPLSINTMKRCAETLARYLQQTSTNVMYFALDSLNRLLNTNPYLTASIVSALPLLFQHMRNPDVGIAMLSVSVIFLLGNKDNSKEIVQEFLDFLPVSPLALRLELCRKSAILAQAYPEPAFFVSVVVQLLYEHGESCDRFIWETAARVIVDQPRLRYIAMPSMSTLIKKNPRMSPQLLKLIVYILGLFSVHKAAWMVDFLMEEIDHQPQQAQCHILTAIARMCCRIPQLITEATCEFFAEKCRSPSPEVSQRAREYYMILTLVTQPCQLLDKLPADLSSDEVDQQIERLALGGVSTFAIDDVDIDSEAIPTTEEQMTAFMFKDSGTLYRDSFIMISVGLIYSQIEVGLIKARCFFENTALPVFENFKAEILVPPVVALAIQDSTEGDTIISTEQYQMSFDLQYNDLTNQFPMIHVTYRCADVPHSIDVALPIFFCRITRQLPLELPAVHQMWTNYFHTPHKDSFTTDITPKTIIDTIKIVLVEEFNMTPIPKDVAPDATEVLAAGQSQFPARQKRTATMQEEVIIFLIKFTIEKKVLQVEVRSSTAGGLNGAICHLKHCFRLSQ